MLFLNPAHTFVNTPFIKLFPAWVHHLFPARASIMVLVWRAPWRVHLGLQVWWNHQSSHSFQIPVFIHSVTFCWASAVSQALMETEPLTSRSARASWGDRHLKRWLQYLLKAIIEACANPVARRRETITFRERLGRLHSGRIFKQCLCKKFQNVFYLIQYYKIASTYHIIN